MATKLFAPFTRFRRRVNDQERLVEDWFIQQETSNSTSIPADNNTSRSFDGSFSVELGENDRRAPVNEITTIVRVRSAWRKFSFSYLGIVLSVSACACFAGSSLFVKLASSVPTSETAFMRLILQAVWSLPFMIFFNDTILHPWKKTKFLLLRSVTGTFAMNLNFYAIKHMDLADSRVLFFTAPVYTAILARIFLKESISKFDLLAMVLSSGGVVLIARPTFIFGSRGLDSSSKQVLLPVLMAILGAVFGACSFVLTRKMKGEVETRVIVFYLSVIGSVASACTALATGQFKFPDCGTHHSLYILSCGLLGYLGQILTTKALTLEKAVVVSLTRTMGLVFSFILQLLVLHVAASGLSIGGAVLVLLGNFSIFVKKFWKMG